MAYIKCENHIKARTKIHNFSHFQQKFFFNKVKNKTFNHWIDSYCGNEICAEIDGAYTICSISIFNLIELIANRILFFFRIGKLYFGS